MASKRLESFTRSSSFMNSRELLSDAIFKTESLKIYVYFAFVLCNTLANFSTFSMVYYPVRIYDFIILQLTIGMSYTFMDIFIKLYTCKLDFNMYLHPLLRGINFGIVLQYVLYILVFANQNSDALRYLFLSLKTPPGWSECPKFLNNCMSSDEVHYRCHHHILTQLSVTSNYLVYSKSILVIDNSEITLRTLLNFAIWTCNFFMSSVSAATLLKIVKFTFYLNLFTTFFIAAVVMFQQKEHVQDILLNILSVKHPVVYHEIILDVCQLYGIGFIGVYDFNTMSPHTLLDNAVMIFSIFILFFLLLRSILVEVIVKSLKKCVIIDYANIMATTQLTVFVLLPLGIQYMHAQKLLELILFFTFTVSQTVLLALMTAIMARLLRGEFRKIKEVYISGLLCFSGFCCSVSLSLFSNQMKVIEKTSLMLRPCLAGSRVAIIMWVYGVNKFSTDIEFWLGFKPVRFWRYCWVLTPIPLLRYSLYVALVYILWHCLKFECPHSHCACASPAPNASSACPALNTSRIQAATIVNCYYLYNKPYSEETLMASLWIGLTVFLVLFGQLKVIYSFMAHNNFIAAFRSSRKYGPPMEEDRSMRRRYDETTQFHRCDHTCIMLDDRIDCMHEPLNIFKKHPETQGTGSVTDILMMETLEDTIARKTSSLIDIKAMHVD